MANGDTSVVTNHRTTPSKLNKNNNTHPNGTSSSQDATNASAQQLNGNSCQVSMEGIKIEVIKNFKNKKLISIFPHIYCVILSLIIQGPQLSFNFVNLKRKTK